MNKFADPSKPVPKHLIKSAGGGRPQRPPSGRIKIQCDPDGINYKNKKKEGTHNNFFQSNSSMNLDQPKSSADAAQINQIFLSRSFKDGDASLRKDSTGSQSLSNLLPSQLEKKQMSIIEGQKRKL